MNELQRKFLDKVKEAVFDLIEDYYETGCLYLAGNVLIALGNVYTIISNGDEDES